MINSWIKHVLQYAKKHNISYKDALQKAKGSYKRGKGVCGGAISHDLKWYVRNLKRIRSIYPRDMTVLSTLRDLEDVLRMMEDDQVDFDTAYLEGLKQEAQSILSQFPSGREEMKY